MDGASGRMKSRGVEGTFCRRCKLRGEGEEEAEESQEKEKKGTPLQL